MVERPEAGVSVEGIGCAVALLAVAALAWGCWTILGADLWFATRARVPKSPLLGAQFRFYVLLPATLTVLGIAGIAAAYRWRRAAKWFGLFGFAELFLLLPFLLNAGGGV